MGCSQAAFGPPSALGAGPGSSPAREKGPSFSAAVDRTSRFGHDFSQVTVHPSAAGVIQTKLAINQPGDVYEQEADHLSDVVMRMPEPRIRRPGSRGGGYPKCQSEHLGKEQGPLPTVRIGSSDLARTAVPPVVDDVLRSIGQPLDPPARAFMQFRFGHDFSQVRVHADARAGDSARALDARAYTVGRDVVFAPEQYRPGTAEGRRLLAHELTHVVQQAGTDEMKVGQNHEKRRLPPITAQIGDVHSPGPRLALQRQPASSRRPERRRVAFLKELAKWPYDAHQHWKRLGFAERMAVLEHMRRYYGGDFAAKFLQYTASPTLEEIDFGPGFPEQTAQWFQARGYRLAQTGAGLDSTLEWWVHPSGKVIMKIRELREGAPPPQAPSPQPQPVIDPPPADFPTDLPEPIDYSRPAPG